MTVSEQVQNIVVYTGGDPRHLPEFEAIRLEINKINHPMQPEVNWKLIESLALTVFRRNGVDLQTAVYYTLARVRLAGLAGFTEGCELLAGIITAEWDRCWPDNEAARVEILDWFNAKASSVLRTLSFNDKNLRLLYRAERALQLINDKLQQLPLRRVPKVENLLIFIQNTGRRIEQAKQRGDARDRRPPTETLVWMPGPEGQQPPSVVVPESGVAAPEPLTSEAYPIDESVLTPGVTVVQRSPARGGARWRLQGFALGILCSLAAAACAFYFYVQPMKQQLTQIASQPLGASMLWLSQPEKESYGRQLEQLAALPPYSVVTLGERAVALAQKRWPQDDQQRRDTRRWQNLMLPAREEAALGSGYFVVRQRLQKLNDELLEQERVRGGLTISYLKTAIYQMQNALNADVPLEELLRQLEVATRNGKPASAVLIKQINERWNVIAGRYYQLVKSNNDSVNR